ncbi:MAG: hypothetical protein IKZ58_00905 [Selenomonadaceae bacterium]|nr:hypothetical protein [Selenomonadaceae bacterium]
MLKRYFVAIVAVFLVLFATGCGGGGQKADADNPQASADKAVLAYAELYGFDKSTHLQDAGLTQKDADSFNNQIILDEVNDYFAKLPFSDDSLAKLKVSFENKFEQLLDIKATLKKDDPEHPVVTLTANVMDEKSVDEQLEKQDGLKAIILIVAGEELGEEKTPEQLKADSEIQQAFLETSNNVINALTAGTPKSIDITCKKVKGADGKTYWAPEDPAAVMNFIQGK